MYIKSTYDGLHVITGTTENVSLLPRPCVPVVKQLFYFKQSLLTIPTLAPVTVILFYHWPARFPREPLVVL